MKWRKWKTAGAGPALRRRVTGPPQLRATQRRGAGHTGGPPPGSVFLLHYGSSELGRLRHARIRLAGKPARNLPHTADWPTRVWEGMYARHPPWAAPPKPACQPTHGYSRSVPPRMTPKCYSDPTTGGGRKLLPQRGRPLPSLASVVPLTLRTSPGPISTGAPQRGAEGPVGGDTTHSIGRGEKPAGRKLSPTGHDAA